MEPYLQLCRTILERGVDKEDRTGVGTRSAFGHQMRFDLSKGFPLVTTKKIAFRLVVSELLWFLKGDTNIAGLLQDNNHIWDEWAFQKWVASAEYTGPDMRDFGLRAASDPAFADALQREKAAFCARVQSDPVFAARYGELGPIYGRQWRSWNASGGQPIDQIREVLRSIREQPDSRRHIVTAWNPSDVPDMALPPCHALFQFYVAEGKLSCQLYQRSADVFLGLPFNIASYALLTMLIARECELAPGEFIHTLGDAHIYRNHFAQVEEQLKRAPRPLPQISWRERPLFDLTPADFTLAGYEPHPAIKAPIAV